MGSASSAQSFASRPLWEYTQAGPVLTIAPGPREAVLNIKSYGPSGAPSGNGNGQSASEAPEFGDSEKSSLGCIVGGTLGTAGALFVGGENIINLIAGGLVVPTSPAALYASLFGVVFASFCAVGQAMTPVVVYAYRRYFEESEAVLSSSAPPARREPAALGRYQKTAYEPIDPNPASYVR
jgi:hypothetical protein